MIHYSSDESEDILNLFNKEAKREYYSNIDYKRFGVRTEDDQCMIAMRQAQQSHKDLLEKMDVCQRKVEKNRKKSSQIGSMTQQRKQVPDEYQQVVCLSARQKTQQEDRYMKDDVISDEYDSEIISSDQDEEES